MFQLVTDAAAESLRVPDGLMRHGSVWISRAAASHLPDVLRDELPFSDRFEQS